MWSRERTLDNFVGSRYHYCRPRFRLVVQLRPSDEGSVGQESVAQSLVWAFFFSVRRVSFPEALGQFARLMRRKKDTSDRRDAQSS